jgi:hypothetical protein
MTESVSRTIRSLRWTHSTPLPRSGKENPGEEEPEEGKETREARNEWAIISGQRGAVVLYLSKVEDTVAPWGDGARTKPMGRAR